MAEKNDDKALVPVGMGERGMILTSFDEVQRAAKCIMQSKFAPKNFTEFPDVVTAILYGCELGLPPLAALQNMAVINGKPSLYGDALPGVCYGSGVLERMTETLTGEGDNLTARCEAWRRGATDPVVHTFSVADAKRAKLWGKAGPWTEYPKRMLQMRARGFALRDACPDALKGMITVEEAQDYPAKPPRNVTPSGATLTATLADREPVSIPEPEPDPVAADDLPFTGPDVVETIAADFNVKAAYVESLMGMHGGDEAEVRKILADKARS